MRRKPETSSSVLAFERVMFLQVLRVWPNLDWGNTDCSTGVEGSRTHCGVELHVAAF